MKAETLRIEAETDHAVEPGEVARIAISPLCCFRCDRVVAADGDAQGDLARFRLSVEVLPALVPLISYSGQPLDEDRTRFAREHNAREVAECAAINATQRAELPARDYADRRLKTIKVGQSLALHVRNVSDAPAVFRAVLDGIGV